MSARRFRVRHYGTCAGCGAALAAGTTGYWDKEGRRLTCEACETAQPAAPAGTDAGEPTPPNAVEPAVEPSGGLKRVRLRRDGLCAGCGSALPARNFAWWDAGTKTLRCDTCHGGGSEGALPVAEPAVPEPAAVEPAPMSTAGGSAQSRYQQLSARREQRIRQAHPVLGGMILALSDEPQSTTAWARGAAGERRVGAMLDKLAGAGVVALHDRRIPRGRANIDHLAVAPGGVWVIDAKRYQGQVAKKDVGGWFSTDWRLYVGRRDCTKLVAAMAGQVEAARAALGPEWSHIPIRPILCFVDAEWSWLAKPFTLEGVTVAWPKATASLLCQPGPLTAGQVAQIAERLAEGLPPAS